MHVSVLLQKENSALVKKWEPSTALLTQVWMAFSNLDFVLFSFQISA